MCIPKIYHHIINENRRASDKYITTKYGSIKNLLRKDSTRSIANVRIHVERSYTTKVHNVGKYNTTD